MKNEWIIWIVTIIVVTEIIFLPLYFKWRDKKKNHAAERPMGIDPEILSLILSSEITEDDGKYVAKISKEKMEQYQMNRAMYGPAFKAAMNSLMEIQISCEEDDKTKTYPFIISCTNINSGLTIVFNEKATEAIKKVQSCNSTTSVL